jgi:hypothetical protein
VGQILQTYPSIGLVFNKTLVTEIFDRCGDGWVTGAAKMLEGLE